MPDREMIERVAKAIYMTEFPTLVTLDSWDEYMHKNDYYECAKAAISAMKEPTENMSINSDRYTENYVTFEEANNIYKSYIDAILR